MNQHLKYGDWRLRTSSKKKPGDWHYVNGVAVQIDAKACTVVNIKTKRSVN